MDEDKKLFRYSGRYGWIYGDSKHFLDNDFLGENYLYYKIIKIKIWTGKIDSKDIINGVQVFYKNILDGNIITPGEYKGDEGCDNVYEFEIKSNEYLINFHIRVDDCITQVGFETNKGNKILVGGTIGEDKLIVSNGGDNIILFLYGSYNNCLHTLGVGYINKKDYLKKFYIGYFELYFKLNKDKEFREEWIKKENLLNENDRILLKVCLLPEDIFEKVIKYVFL
jgi:hypothetical protein